MPRKNRRDNNENEQSAFRDEGNAELKDSDIMQLYTSQNKFAEFVHTLGDNATVPLNEANYRYSKQILQGTNSTNTIQRLVTARVDKMIKNRRLKRNWGKEDCLILAWVLEKLTNGRHLKSPEKLKKFYWEAASEVIPGSTAQQCMFKWLSMKKIKLENHKWQSSESKLLQKLVEELGTENWKQISRRLYYANVLEDKKYRHPKQCRQQWNCYLNPNLKKGPWQPSEDLKLLTMVMSEQGKRKWSDFSRNIEGRTENALKNRYAFLIQNKKEKYPRTSELQLIKMCFEDIKERSPAPLKQQTQIDEEERMEVSAKEMKQQSPMPEKKHFSYRDEHDDASMILSGDFTTTAFKKPVHEQKEEEPVKKQRKEESIPVFQNIEKLVFDEREKFEVKECSIEEMMRFMSKTKDFLIPARLGKNKELVPLFLEHSSKNDI